MKTLKMVLAEIPCNEETDNLESMEVEGGSAPVNDSSLLGCLYLTYPLGHLAIGPTAGLGKRTPTLYLKNCQ